MTDKSRTIQLTNLLNMEKIKTKYYQDMLQRLVPRLEVLRDNATNPVVYRELSDICSTLTIKSFTEPSIISSVERHKRIKKPEWDNPDHYFLDEQWSS